MQVKRKTVTTARSTRSGCWCLAIGAATSVLGMIVYHSTEGLAALRDANKTDDDRADDFKWEYKSQAPPAGPLRGILFLAHGCQHSMTDWWPPSPDCRACIGLPEEAAIVRMALERNLLVVAASSWNRSSKCWSSNDGPRVAELMIRLQKEHSGGKHSNKNNLPLYAFGASSGGTFVSSVLPGAVQAGGSQLSGIISQIMAVPLSAESPPAPAIVYITMNRDEYTDARARSNCQQLMSSAEETASSKRSKVRCKQIRLGPLPLSGDYFSNRIGSVPPGASERMVRALRDSAFLDEEDMLVDDPRRTEWRIALRKVVGSADSLVADQSPVAEVLNVAWAMHEMSRDGVAESLDFLLSPPSAEGANDV